MTIDYLLHESAVGYAVFQVRQQPDTVGNRLQEYQASMQDLGKFGKMVKLISFAPFQGASHALENANDISAGIASPFLLSLLEINLPKSKNVTLGVSDKLLAGAIRSSIPTLQCETSETSEIVQDMLRGIRQHSHKLLKQLQQGDVERAQLGLGHAYSRGRVKFSVHKTDNHIIQAIATLDHLDKAINTFSMRVREWYSWHFPELIRIVSENQQYARVALWIGDKNRLSDADLEDLTAQCNDDAETAQSIIDAAKVSMGRDLLPTDMENVTSFASRVVSLAKYRKNLHNYLIEKMGIVAPNLATLLGETIGARLISHAGSLTSLSKYPASTVQILGAEKALFRALKTKGNTPKYGLIYHSSFIGRAGQKNKGRISRFLANKCSIASRIDNFSEQPTTKFGLALKAQVEERLRFYDSGEAPTKNEVAMRNAMDSILQDLEGGGPSAKADNDDDEMADIVPRALPTKEAVAPDSIEEDKAQRRKLKKDKKEKKQKMEKEEKKDKQDKKKRRISEIQGNEEDASSSKEKKKKKKRDSKKA